MTVSPIFPVPMTPTVMLQSSFPRISLREKSCPTYLVKMAFIFRIDINMAMTVYSATVWGV
jgi:hypothetical protein